jgi:hypothetical protein
MGFYVFQNLMGPWRIAVAERIVAREDFVPLPVERRGHDRRVSMLFQARQNVAQPIIVSRKHAKGQKTERNDVSRIDQLELFGEQGQVCFHDTPRGIYRIGTRAFHKIAYVHAMLPQAGLDAVLVGNLPASFVNIFDNLQVHKPRLS